MISYLSWDTAFFGFRIAEATGAGLQGISFPQLQEQIRQGGYRLVYLKLPDMHLETGRSQSQGFHQMMQKAGVLLADRKLTYHKQVNPCLKNYRNTSITPETAIPVSEKLQALALQAGEFSRFRTDPRFPRHLFVRLYIEWLLKSLTGEIASQVLVWTDAYRSIRGFVTISHKQAYSEIGLIAVDEASRGQQIGSQLLKAAEAACAQAGTSQLLVATQQDNIPACRFYENYGFRIKDITHIYHWWD